MTRAARRSVIVVSAVVLVLALGLGVTWLNRRAAARELLVGWLDRRGIPAQVTVERLELDGFVGSLSVGDPDDPQASVQRVEVDYALSMPWAQAGMGMTPQRIRLVQPVVRADWRDGRLSFGVLEPLIEEFARRPPRADTRGPVVVVETGRLRLSTDYGAVTLLADATVDDGRLMKLNARMPAAAVRSGTLDGRGLGGRLDLSTEGDRVALSYDLVADRLDAPRLSVREARLVGSAALPYPDMRTRRGDGAAAVDLTLTGSRLAWGDVEGTQAALRLSAEGRVTGWIETLAFNGIVRPRLTATRLTVAGADARAVDVALDQASALVSRAGAGADWSVEGPARMTAASVTTGDFALRGVQVRTARLALSADGGDSQLSGALAATVDRLSLADLTLSGATGRFDVDVATAREPVLSGTGRLVAASGSWPLFGAPVGDDVPELAEMKRALSAFTLEAPGVAVSVGAAGPRVALTAPARLRPSTGGEIVVAGAAEPLFNARPGVAAGGAFALTATRGPGVPSARFDVTDWHLTPGGFAAELAGRAALDFGLARGVTVDTAGRLASDRGRLTYRAGSCSSFRVDTLDLDENDVAGVSGRLCPDGGPLVEASGGRWRVKGAMRDIAAAVPFLDLTLAKGSGALSATGGREGLGLVADVASASLSDAVEPRRFNTLTISGQATLAGERWSGRFDLARLGRPLGRLDLVHDGATGVGGVILGAPDLVFAEGGLQPADLSPLAADFVQSPATGSARFSGRVDWSPTLPPGGTSSGRLTIPGLDFVSPLGPVEGLTGTVEFSSLAPLTAAPGQVLKARTIRTFADLTELDLSFALDPGGVTVAGGVISAAGGTFSIEPLTVPLDGGAFSGVIVLDRVQLGQLIAGAGFGDKVAIDAVVSGRLPFTSDPERGVTITGGSLYAVQPGRLSIQREALSGLEAGGGGEVPPGTVEDLAYQAMENLAFQTLTADVNSLDQGRVGLLFRIVGRHDPPERQELRLTLPELISREFLNRTLPLPSDTGIDLTLDTTLNLNQLVSDLLAMNRARNGQATPSE